MNYKAIDIATEIKSENDVTSSIGLSFIESWVLNNIGTLNNLIGTTFSINDAYEITPNLAEEEKSIYKKLFEIYYYDKLIRTNLGSSSFDVVQEVTEGDNKIKLVSRTDIAKVYADMRKTSQSDLKSLVDKYKQHSVAPLSVDGVESTIDYPTFYPYPGYNPRRGYR